MKTTHTLQDVDALLLEKVILLKTAKGKEEKEKLRKQIQKLEKHFNDCNDKQINGHKYPEKLKSLYDTSPYTEKQKKEALKLIDSVPDQGISVIEPLFDELDVSGVSVGKNRFEYIE
jgi:hypothetical protein